MHNFQNQTSDFLVSNVFYIKGETSCSNFIMYVEIFVDSVLGDIYRPHWYIGRYAIILMWQLSM